jgi:hypothetical protein
VPNGLLFIAIGLGSAAAVAAVANHVRRRRVIRAIRLRRIVKRLGDGEIVRCLGAGTEGAVYLMRGGGREGHLEAVKVSPRAGDAAERAAVLARLREAHARYPDHLTVRWVALHATGRLEVGGREYLIQHMDYAPGPTLRHLIRRGALQRIPACFLAEWARDTLAQWSWQESEGLALTGLILRNLSVTPQGILFRHDYDALHDEMTAEHRWRGRYRALRVAQRLLEDLGARGSASRAGLASPEREVCRRAADLVPELDEARISLQRHEKRLTAEEIASLHQRLEEPYHAWIREIQAIAALWPSEELRRPDPQTVMHRHIPRFYR